MNDLAAMEAFNKHVEDKFDPSWHSCLDESAVAFLNEHCPTWVSVRRKPHPFRNEYHTIACCLSKIFPQWHWWKLPPTMCRTPKAASWCKINHLEWPISLSMPLPLPVNEEQRCLEWQWILLVVTQYSKVRCKNWSVLSAMDKIWQKLGWRNERWILFLHYEPF